MLNLSAYIINYTELLDLGIKVLHLTNNQVKSARTDFKQINEVAYELLQLWPRQQKSSNDALNLLHTRLSEVNWNQLSFVLAMGNEPKGTTSSSKNAPVDNWITGLLFFFLWKLWYLSRFCFCKTNFFQTGWESIQKIQEWTRQSLREKPFSTAKGKIWTMTPSHIPLGKIYTQLNLLQKMRGICNIKTAPLSDVSQLFNPNLTKTATEIILVTGNACFPVAVCNMFLPHNQVPAM